MTNDEIILRIGYLQTAIFFLIALVAVQVLTGTAIASVVVRQLRRVGRLLKLAERHGEVSDSQKEAATTAVKQIVDTAAKTAEAATVAATLVKETAAAVKDDLLRMTSGDSGPSVVMHGPRAVASKQT